jgi:hypothetical protein
MPEIDQTESIEDLKTELLNYKLDEVLTFYTEDFGGDTSEEIENQVILELNEDNPEFQNLLKKKIIFLWFDLINKVVSRLHQGVNEHPPNTTVDFSDIIIEINTIKEKARENLNDFEALKNLYLDEVDKLKIRVKSKLEVAKNLREEKKMDNWKAYGLSFFTLFLGYFLTKYF